MNDGRGMLKQALVRISAEPFSTEGMMQVFSTSSRPVRETIIEIADKLRASEGVRRALENIPSREIEKRLVLADYDRRGGDGDCHAVGKAAHNLANGDPRKQSNWERKIRRWAAERKNSDKCPETG